jgi:hypothetical protein
MDDAHLSHIPQTLNPETRSREPNGEPVVQHRLGGASDAVKCCSTFDAAWSVREEGGCAHLSQECDVVLLSLLGLLRPPAASRLVKTGYESEAQTRQTYPQYASSTSLQK